LIHEGPLLDRFIAKEYENYFKFFADDSFATPKDERTPQMEEQIKQARLKIQKYGDDLLDQLRLDSDHPLRRHKNLNIRIIEEHNINVSDEKSIHNLVWELLEHPDCWKRRKPDRVIVTRIICPPIRHSLPGSSMATMSMGLRDEKLTRILLIIGRDLSKEHFNDTNWKYREKAPPSLIQLPLMQVMHHLEEIGCKRKVQLDILRPATFSELTSYLGVNTNDPNAVVQNFDIIHVDMHSEMRYPVPRYGSPFVSITLSPRIIS
jgi:hypothetical protein